MNELEMMMKFFPVLSMPLVPEKGFTSLDQVVSKLDYRGKASQLPAELKRLEIPVHSFRTKSSQIGLFVPNASLPKE